MKKVFKPFMVVVAVAGLMAVNSCSKTCDPGYEGTDCKTETRTKMLGNYSASESKNGGSAYSYSGSIDSSSTDVQTIVINRLPDGSNFFNTNIKATISDNAITIASQNPDGDSYYIQGTGAYASGVISFTYTVTGPNANDSTVTDSYSATWTKQ